MTRNKKIAAVLSVVAAVIVICILSIQPKHDIKAHVVTAEELEASETVKNYILELDGTEFGYDVVFVRITEKTVVQRADGMQFMPEVFAKGDIVTVWFDKDTADRKVIDAEKVVFEG